MAKRLGMSLGSKRASYSEGNKDFEAVEDDWAVVDNNI